MSRVQSLVSY